ncbi:MAG: NAD(P)/FAD-dependent oxidoreductase [Microbacterium sp.]|uniref:bifunctional NAD(P)/FAD-dependent oxidoreductase/class I SAM-dependent methyltransferase n=1 Tax=Microbacterium sp. TaxID=51671 RepID=UPI0026072607|nr:bifunctional NAD(P)/FAD-dependent oxidoreductase/class I SAM-dependent methyltransferase [Microbacterium sp.]MCX6502469.1 NAD(P)/FAD-dependent oxidoreductase [Microbacterium sp.]
MHSQTWDVIIVGGGPAGLSAALMLGRARRRVLVVDAGSPRNRFAAHMHGVLGHEGTSPHDLLARGREEVRGYGVELIDGNLERVDRVAGGHAVMTSDGGTHQTRALIVATGLTDQLPSIPGLAERWGTSVLHCPYCHGWEVRDQHLGVLTTSPLSLHQAELVRQWSDRVTVFTAGLGPLSAETERRLRVRGIELVSEPVAEILGEGDAIRALRLSDGREVPVDALFTAGAPHPHDELVASLDLTRDDTPFGSFLAIDATGRTSDERIWAVGNVVTPGATVPMSIGAGAATGGAVNAALVGWDVDDALTAAQTPTEPADYWEERYAGSERVWSGRANRVLTEVAAMLPPGRALDLGCGEGADVIWLAQHGWTATGIDISPTAVRRATEAASAAGLPVEQAQFHSVDLTALPTGSYDLVSASFLHSPVRLPREAILRQAADRVAPGGHLLITSHAAPPPGSNVPHVHEHRFLTPDEEIEQLALDPQRWEVVLAESRPRDATLRDGTVATLDDVIVLVRRIGAHR